MEGRSAKNTTTVAVRANARRRDRREMSARSGVPGRGSQMAATNAASAKIAAESMTGSTVVTSTAVWAMCRSTSDPMRPPLPGQYSHQLGRGYGPNGSHCGFGRATIE